MNTKNSRTNEPKRFRLHFTDKLNLKNNKTIALANLSIYYTWQNVKSAYKNNKFKITGPTWDETFDLADGSYIISDIQDYFEFFIEKHETITTDEISPILIYPNKIKNRIVFKIIGLKIIDSVFNYIDVWFTDQDNRSLQIEDNVNNILIVSAENA